MGASVSAPEAEAAPPPLQRLKKRKDFLLAARARRWTARGFVLQARRRRDDERAAPSDLIRIGYTASKKVGGAVARNRSKRRLRALAEPALAQLGRPGWDYVLIARAGETALRPFTQMQSELRRAVEKVHDGGSGGRGARPEKRQSRRR